MRFRGQILFQEQRGARVHHVLIKDVHAFHIQPCAHAVFAERATIFGQGADQFIEHVASLRGRVAGAIAGAGAEAGAPEVFQPVALDQHFVVRQALLVGVRGAIDVIGQ